MIISLYEWMNIRFLDNHLDKEIVADELIQMKIKYWISMSIRRDCVISIWKGDVNFVYICLATPQTFGVKCNSRKILFTKIKNKQACWREDCGLWMYKPGAAGEWAHSGSLVKCSQSKTNATEKICISLPCCNDPSRACSSLHHCSTSVPVMWQGLASKTHTYTFNPLPL